MSLGRIKTFKLFQHSTVKFVGSGDKALFAINAPGNIAAEDSGKNNGNDFIEMINDKIADIYIDFVLLLCSVMPLWVIFATLIKAFEPLVRLELRGINRSGNTSD